MYIDALNIVKFQYVLSGILFLYGACLGLGVLGVGIYILRAFTQSVTKERDRWLAFVGTGLVIIGIVLFSIFLGLGLFRVLNPSYYALDYLLNAVRMRTIP